MNRRRILSALLVLSPFVFFVATTAGQKTHVAKTYRAYIGTYTTKTSSKGIYEFSFDPATGKMSAPALAAPARDPSWVIIHPNNKFLYAGNEAGKDSTISAFSIAPNGKLTLLNQLPALGEDPCYLSFDQTGKYLFVANYTSGNVVVFPISANGKFGEHTASVKDEGTLGPNKERQDAPHAHWIAASQHNRFAYVADLGLDKVLVYKFDASQGTLASSDSAIAKPGTGPRHLAFSHDGKYLYVLGELDSTVTVFSNDNEKFVPLQKVPMLPAGFSGRNDAAEIYLHPSGKFLYASNRGHDSIVVFAINQSDGKLTQVADTPTGGKEPRHFAIDPAGNFLLAENQNSDTIVELRIDPSTGKLTPTGETLSVPSPVCLTFLPLD